MVLAQALGLPTASVTTGRAGERSDLLVERYDRHVDHGAVTRLHQEDFCQALGLPPAAKYEFNGTGVSRALACRCIRGGQGAYDRC